MVTAPDFKLFRLTGEPRALGGGLPSDPGDELTRCRRRIGAGTALWAGEAGVRVGAEGWVALSGAGAADYNLIGCFASSPHAPPLRESAQTLLNRRVPGMMMVGGAALGDVQQLAELRWICAGSVAVMRLVLDGAADPPASVTAGRLAGDGLEPARELVGEAFGLDEALARVAIPDDLLGSANQGLWGSRSPEGQLVSCLTTIQVQDTIVIWSMATPAALRRRGYGRAALAAALHGARRAGATDSILYASHAGESLYRKLGYREVDRWQLWSRARWMLGRA